MDAIIELDDVEKVYGDEGNEVRALDGVNLKIKKRDFVSIMGPSGSGKSTLLHIMGALDKPTSGKVYVDGKNITEASDNELAKIRGEKVGFVFQVFNLYPTLTALENVELPMMILEKDKNERMKKAEHLLAIVGLKDRGSHYPSQLSGGQRQRVAIARALANNPSFILADEPTGNLDSKSGLEIMKMFVNLNRKENITVIVVTHDANIASHSKRIIKIKDGRIVN